MPENNTPRFVPAEATYYDPVSKKDELAWGVLDTQESLFAPFGGNEALATFAAEKVTEKPYLPWSFVSVFILATN